MTDRPSATDPNVGREPWNKGKLIGAKPPLRPKHGWAICTRLQLERNHRDLALVNLAIYSKLRGCDGVAIGSRTSHLVGVLSIVPQYDSARRAGRQSLK